MVSKSSASKKPVRAFLGCGISISGAAPSFPSFTASRSIRFSAASRFTIVASAYPCLCAHSRYFWASPHEILAALWWPKYSVSRFRSVSSVPPRAPTADPVVGSDQTTERLEGHLPRRRHGAVRQCYPPVAVQLQILDGLGPGPVLAVVVSASKERPYFTGHAYKRVGSKTVKASGEMFEELVASRNDKVRRIVRHKGRHITFVRYVAAFGRVQPPSASRVRDRGMRRFLGTRASRRQWPRRECSP